MVFSAFDVKKRLIDILPQSVKITSGVVNNVTLMVNTAFPLVLKSTKCTQVDKTALQKDLTDLLWP